MRYHPLRHLGLKFLSIGLATLLWLAVARDPVVERTLRVPLQFQNIPEGLDLIGAPPSTIDVRVRGASGMVSRLDPGEIVAIVDLRTARPGLRLVHILTDQVRAPFGVNVEQVAPPTIGLEFERTASKIVPVVPAVDGEPAPGYVVGAVTSDPAQIELVGPASHLKTITEATTEPVSVAGATRTIREEVTMGVADAEIRLKDVRDAIVTVPILPAPVERRVNGVAVHMRNLSGGLSARIVPPVVSVHLRGTRELLTNVGVGSLNGFVDLAGLGPGRYNLPVRVESDRPVGISVIDPSAVEVRIR